MHDWRLCRGSASRRQQAVDGGERVRNVALGPDQQPLRVDQQPMLGSAKRGQEDLDLLKNIMRTIANMSSLTYSCEINVVPPLYFTSNFNAEKGISNEWLR
jgi:hypothetical protein